MEQNVEATPNGLENTHLQNYANNTKSMLSKELLKKTS
jgi:hypothetical protein